MKVLNVGFANISPKDSIDFFQSFLKGLLLTDSDKLALKSEELKPKILEYLKEHPGSYFSDLLENLNADIFELRYTIERLKRENKIVRNK